MEVVVKEFDDIKSNLLLWLKKGLTPKEILRNYPPNVRDKIMLLM